MIEIIRFLVEFWLSLRQEDIQVKGRLPDLLGLTENLAGNALSSHVGLLSAIARSQPFYDI